MRMIYVIFGLSAVGMLLPIFRGVLGMTPLEENLSQVFLWTTVALLAGLKFRRPLPEEKKIWQKWIWVVLAAAAILNAGENALLAYGVFF